jgi:hypothetical protein
MPETPATPAAGPEVTPTPVTPAAPAPADDNPPGADALGDAGKRALDTMKAERNAERERRKAAEAELEALRNPKPAADPAEPSEADRKLNARIVRAEIKAAAAGKFADPDDALVYLKDKARSFKVDENGEVDPAAISAAITDLLTRKPHLAAKPVPPTFEGSADGGAAGREAGPSQLTREDLKGKSPEFIAKARAEGRLKTLLGHTT